MKLLIPLSIHFLFLIAYNNLANAQQANEDFYETVRKLYDLGGKENYSLAVLKAMFTDKESIEKMDSTRLAEVHATLSSSHSRLARIHLLENDTSRVRTSEEAAEQHLQYAEEADSNSSLVFTAKALIDRHKRDIKSMTHNINEALKRDSLNYEAYALSGDLITMLNARDYESAKKHYEKCLSINPNFAPAYINLGTIYTATDDIPAAMKSYNDALKINPKYALTYYNQGNMYHNQNQLDKAIQNLNKCIEINPGFFYAYLSLGKVYISKGDNSKALSSYEKAIQINPHIPESYFRLDNLKGKEIDPRLNRVFLFIVNHMKGDIRETENNLLNLGKCYKFLGEYEKAITYYNKLLELNDKDSYAYFGLAEIYFAQKKYEESLSHYLKFDFKLVSAHTGIAKIYAIKNEKEKSFEYLESALKTGMPIADDLNDSSFNKIRNTEQFEKIYGYSENYKQAKDLLKKGIGQEENKEYDSAMATYDKVIELYPYLYDSYARLGSLYKVIKKENDTAEKYLLIAIDCYPHEKFSLYNLACIYSLRNKKGKAMEYLEKSLESGFKDLEHVKSDADFANIRKSKAYKEVLAKYEK